MLKQRLISYRQPTLIKGVNVKDHKHNGSTNHKQHNVGGLSHPCAPRLVTLFVLRFSLLLFVCNVAYAQECAGFRPEKPDTRIVGGWPAKTANWPGLVSLRLRNPVNDEAVYICGGSQVAEKWILTAAHCLRNENFDLTETLDPPYTLPIDLFHDEPLEEGTGNLEIVLGKERLSSVNTTDVGKITRLIPHPGFDTRTLENDIALIELADKISGPIVRLSSQPAHDPIDPPGTNLMVGGYGLQHYKAPLVQFEHSSGAAHFAGSKILQETPVPFVNTKECLEANSGTQRVIGSGQLCAGFELGDQDSCTGDSGSQLVAFDNDGCPYQVGIVSWGRKCALEKAYGVYARVSAHHQWISETIDNAAGFANVDSNRITDWSSVEHAVSLVNQELATVESLLEGRARAVKLTLVEKHSGNPIVNNSKIKLGQEYFMEISSETNGHLVVVDIDAAGSVTQILPNNYGTQDTPTTINSSETLMIPVEDVYNFSAFGASEPLGKTRLLALVIPIQQTVPDFIKIDREQGAVRGFKPVKSSNRYFVDLIDLIRRDHQPEDNNRGLIPTTNKWSYSLSNYTIVQ